MPTHGSYYFLCFPLDPTALSSPALLLPLWKLLLEQHCRFLIFCSPPHATVTWFCSLPAALVLRVLGVDFLEFPEYLSPTQRPPTLWIPTSVT